MESLIASYASDDEEEEQSPHRLGTTAVAAGTTATATAKYSELDSQPIPQPKSLLFGVLPKPAGQASSGKRRVVQFQPPVPRLDPKTGEDEDQDEELSRKRSKSSILASSASEPQRSGIAAFLPAPKHSTAKLLGDGTRSIRDRAAPAAGLSLDETPAAIPEPKTQETDPVDEAMPAAPGPELQAGDYAEWQAGADVDTWAHASADVASQHAEVDDSFARLIANESRRSKGIQIREVKQQDLTLKPEERLRLDRTRVTSAAPSFGPAFNPSATKDDTKVSKLHRRKHQIGSLYRDMKAKAPELAERRAKGLLTKAETHAKYGW